MAVPVNRITILLDFFPPAGNILHNSVAISKNARQKILDLQNKPSRNFDFLHDLINSVLKKMGLPASVSLTADQPEADLPQFSRLRLVPDELARVS